MPAIMRDLTSLLTTSTYYPLNVAALAEVTTFELRFRSRGLYKWLVFLARLGGTTVLLFMVHNLKIVISAKKL